jgi:hypothetical protein
MSSAVIRRKKNFKSKKERKNFKLGKSSKIREKEGKLGGNKEN